MSAPPPKLPPNFHAPWEVIGRREVYSCPPWISLEVQEVRLPDGRRVDDYHRINLPDYTVIFVETADWRIVVERQYKHGVGSVTLTLPGGLISPGEDPLAGAQRELLEETGFEAEGWRSLGSFVQNSNYAGSRGHLFAARNGHFVRPPKSGDLENIETLLLTRDELFRAIQRNEIHVTSFVAAIALATHPNL
ncbi:MAG: NUDIX hydrolase [Verrucomicrobiales bacterium]|nr:NUDIX hydrolase [Verrucomicrobiales bacterium]